MEKYKVLLDKALLHIKGVEDEVGIDTLAFPGGTNMKNGNSPYSFEIISYLIVR
jgi:hypothetical protein